MRPIEAALREDASVSSLGQNQFAQAGGLQAIDVALMTDVEHALTAQGQQIPLGSLENKPLHAVAGLARPEVFFDMLRKTGLTLASTTPLPDHHDYQNWQTTHKNEGFLLCTEKDAAKLWPHEPGALAVPLILTPEADFWTALDVRVQQLLKV